MHLRLVELNEQSTEKNLLVSLVHTSLNNFFNFYSNVLLSPFLKINEIGTILNFEHENFQLSAIINQQVIFKNFASVNSQATFV